MRITKEYLAGFVDGEGSITLYKRKDIRTKKGFTINAKFSIGNTNQDFMKELNSCGGQPFIRKYNGENCKPLYELNIQDLKGIRVFLKAIQPYLIIKKKQAELMIEFIESRLSHKGSGYTEREMEITGLITALNKKGELVNK